VPFDAGEPKGGKSSRPEQELRVKWTLYNTSDAPISQCRLAADLRSMQDSKIKLQPDDMVMPAGEEARSFRHLPYFEGGNFPGAVVYFTDAAGVRWRRDSLGNLDLMHRPRRGMRRGHRTIEEPPA
jgi:hypothetical protein